MCVRDKWISLTFFGQEKLLAFTMFSEYEDVLIEFTFVPVLSPPLCTSCVSYHILRPFLPVCVPDFRTLALFTIVSLCPYFSAGHMVHFWKSRCCRKQRNTSLSKFLRDNKIWFLRFKYFLLNFWIKLIRF